MCDWIEGVVKLYILAMIMIIHCWVVLPMEAGSWSYEP